MQGTYILNQTFESLRILALGDTAKIFEKLPVFKMSRKFIQSMTVTLVRSGPKDSENVWDL